MEKDLKQINDYHKKAMGIVWESIMRKEVEKIKKDEEEVPIHHCPSYKEEIDLKIRINSK